MELSEDVKKRIRKQESTPFGKVEMSRKIIHQLLHDRLLFLFNEFIAEEDYKKDGEPAQLKRFTPKQIVALVQAFTPYFEICALCVNDDKCAIQDGIKNATIHTHIALQQAHPNIQVDPTFTITSCGMWDFIDAAKLMTQGWDKSRQSMLRGEVSEK